MPVAGVKPLVIPLEQFGLTGIEQAVNFPPEAARTVIDTAAHANFVIVLN